MALVALVTLLAFVGGTAGAASHSDAPLIKQDPQANLTDVYAFIGTKYNNPREKVLNVVVHVRPFSEPGDGVIYDRFADDARYSIHIADPATGADVIRYDFKFSNVNPQSAPGLKNPNTILSYGRGAELGAINNVGDARQNFVQTLRRHESGAEGRRQGAPRPDRGGGERSADTAPERRRADHPGLQRCERQGRVGRGHLRRARSLHASDGVRPGLR